MSDWAGKRMGESFERLTKEYFFEYHLADCKHCRDDQNIPGPVKMLRHNDTLQLMPDNCVCFLCGQRYYIEYEDLREFLGYSPSLENIHEYAKVYERYKLRYRSIDAEWKSS